MEWVADQAAILAGDPRTSWFVSEDPDRNGVWWNYRRAAEKLAESDATHVLVLQDDLMLCQHFVDGCYKLIELKPDRLVSLFYARASFARAADEANTGWHTDIDGLFGSMFLCPMEFLRDFLSWVDLHVKPECPHDDERWALWSRFSPVSPREVWTPTECLVEHLGHRRSVIGHRLSKFQAARFCEDAALVDWSYGIERPWRAPSRNRLWNIKQSYIP